MTTSTTDLLTYETAAQRLGMSERHVRRLVAERRIAHIRLGRAVRIDPTDIDAYLAANRVEPLTDSDVWSTVRTIG